GPRPGIVSDGSPVTCHGIKPHVFRSRGDSELLRGPRDGVPTPGNMTHAVARLRCRTRPRDARGLVCCSPPKGTGGATQNHHHTRGLRGAFVCFCAGSRLTPLLGLGQSVLALRVAALRRRPGPFSLQSPRSPYSVIAARRPGGSGGPLPDLN